MAVLRLPALADVSVPSTGRFVDAFAEAQALDTDAFPGGTHAPAYVAAVDRAERAWHAARQAAERIRLSTLTPAERATVERVIKLLTTARDSDNDAERLAAYSRARSELAKLDKAGVDPRAAARHGRPRRRQPGRAARLSTPGARCAVATPARATPTAAARACARRAAHARLAFRRGRARRRAPRRRPSGRRAPARPPCAAERGVVLDDVHRVHPRLRDDLLVLEQGEQLQAGAAAGLQRAEHVALPPQLQVELGQLEAVGGGGDRSRRVRAAVPAGISVTSRHTPAR